MSFELKFTQRAEDETSILHARRAVQGDEAMISADHNLKFQNMEHTNWLAKPTPANISTVYAGDVASMLGVLDDSSVDLVITSPPYAERRKKAYGGIAAEKYVEWFLPISAELLRVLKPTGSFVLNIKEGTHKGERQTYVYKLALALRTQGWLFVDELIWHKTNPFATGYKNRLKDGF
jgi:DNA modification methylase